MLTAGQALGGALLSQRRLRLPVVKLVRHWRVKFFPHSGETKLQWEGKYMNGNAVMKFGMADMHVGLAGHAWQPHFQILSALYPHVCAENFSPFTFTFCHDDFDHICHRKENILMDASSAKLSLTLVRRSVYVSKIRLPNLVA